jgi:Flp pilus assembly protein TadD
MLAEGQVRTACALGEAIAQREPRLATAHGFLGRCYARAGRFGEARASYRRYLDLAPDAVDAPFVRAIVDGPH